MEEKGVKEVREANFQLDRENQLLKIDYDSKIQDYESRLGNL